MDALNEQGLFWMTSQLDSGFFIPEDAVSGVLVISEEGLASLSLNGIFAKEDCLSSLLSNEDVPDGLFIAGVLKSDARKVFLMGLGRGGGKFVSGGISHERYIAHYSLVGGVEKCESIHDQCFSSMLMGLGEYQDWLGYKIVKAERLESGLSVGVNLPKDFSVRVNDDIELGLSGMYSARWDDTNQGVGLNITAGMNWEMHFKSLISVASAQDFFRIVAEFMMLLSASGCKPDWPIMIVEEEGEKKKSKLYFLREKELVAVPKRHDGFVYFESVLPDIGSLFRGWLDLRERLGAGAYLFFLALTPGRLFTEHLYASIVWGMECLHRRLIGNSKPRDEDKIKRQLEAVDTLTQLNSKERAAIKGFVSRVIEPSLKERLIFLIEQLPINFDRHELEDFCSKCADRRNDISHFGGYREQITDEAMNKFYAELNSKILVLSRLYGAVLLKSIGVSESLISHYFYGGIKSRALKLHFEDAGLRILDR